jgi:hypothetical protein
MKSVPTNDTPAFDAVKAVAEYRRVNKQRNATDKAGQDNATNASKARRANRAKLQTAAVQMRQAWMEWQGEDSLDEMAFGEPIE